MDQIILILLVTFVAVLSAVLSYSLSIASARWAHRLHALDEPRENSRKIHSKITPLFGGVGIGLTLLVSSIILYVNGFFPGITPIQLFGFISGVLILLVGGMTDDVKPRPAWVQILFPMSASVVIYLTGTGILQITNPNGIGGIPFPEWFSFLATVLWLLFATYATKLLDGLDGLVTGMAVIGSGMIGALTVSTAYFQPGVAMLSAVIGGGFFGFLPRNLHPAKQFLGESGSTLAGFTLGFLAIVSSAKIAIALAVLAIPIADAGCVVYGRIRRGVKIWSGDDTHLHFRLLKSGIPHRTVVFLLWGFSFFAGVIALGLQTRGKVFLVATLVVFTILLSWFTTKYGKRVSSE
ncbi:MAG: undecaprenyl/decaprenyl-phosphate alpha-N-acetylglucosaminyl 1-phosphate transferase [bacterium]|nr:undecaprenyl/decaprenyl-phosphate alpha-N-acetylglucosaminyl 1-phosphate transferase [bacterium]